MTKKLTFEYEDGEVMRYMRENVAVIKLKGNVFGGMTDLETVEENAFRIMISLEEDTNVNALVVVNEHGIFGEEAYREFLSEIAGKEGTSDNLQNFLEFDKWIFSRQRNSGVATSGHENAEFSKSAFPACRAQS